MAREVINVGAAPNDGTGDPIRTAYIKCNANFGELYARVQTSPPPTLVGTPGDVSGMYAYDSNYFYYCFQDYDGSSIIWGQLGGSTPVALNNGTSNVAVAASGPVTFGVGGVSNVAVITAENFTTTGNIIAGADIVASGNISATNLDITGGLSVTGNITLGNLIPSANITYDLGSPTAAWRDLYLSGSTIYLDGATITANATAMTLTTQSGSSFVVGGTGGNSTGSFGTMQVAGNVSAANVVTTNNVTAAGNISGTYVFGDGSFLTNVTAAANVAVTQIANGTSRIGIAGTNGYGQIDVGGVANVAVFTPAGTYIAGVLEATGNIQGGNVFAIGNIAADYFLGDGSQLTNLPVTYGNANVAAYLPTYTGNLAGSRLAVNGGVGNTWSIDGNVLTAPSGGVWRSELDSEDDYITSAANGYINLQSLYADGNIASELHLEHGRAQIRVADSPFVEWNFLNTGELTAPGNISTTGNISTSANIAGDAGVFNDVVVNNAITNKLLYVDSNQMIYDTAFSYDLGNNAISGSGNITAGYFIGDGSLLANVVSTYGNANVAAYLPTYTGDVSVGNIVNANANGVGNIGSDTTYFNTVFAQATSAQYADLAEYYLCDQQYEPGTVLKFGGVAEVTIADTDADPTIAGVVSTAPAYIMNAKIVGQHSVAVALMGRVPVKVRGPVRRGQMLVSAGDGYARAEDTPPTGTVIGKAVKDFNGEVGVIEVVVGRL